jgi:hypothetical protein
VLAGLSDAMVRRVASGSSSAGPNNKQIALVNVIRVNDDRDRDSHQRHRPLVDPDTRRNQD